MRRVSSPFNSLFEMQEKAKTALGQKAEEKTFNSLFEMPLKRVGGGPRHVERYFQFSI